MRLAIPLALLVAACVPDPVVLKDTDTGEVVEDTGDAPTCGLEDLVFRAVVKDPGGACTECPHGVMLGFFGWVVNPCLEAVTLTTSALWLVQSYGLEPLGLEASEPPRDESHEWVLQPEGVLEHAIMEMTLPEEQYVLSLEFSDLPTPHSASVSFLVTNQ